MAIVGIEGVLQQLQATAVSAANRSQNSEAPQGICCGAQAAVNRISETQNNARVQAQNFEMGVTGVALNDVMVDLQKSGISLQMGIQVRNRLVAAYQDIMNMQV